MSPKEYTIEVRSRIENLPSEDCRQLLNEIVDELYLDAGDTEDVLNPEQEWTEDTVEGVANLLDRKLNLREP